MKKQTLSIIILIVVIILGLIILEAYLLINENQKENQGSYSDIPQNEMIPPINEEENLNEVEEVSSVVNKEYLMAFHACDTAATDCMNPKNHMVYLAQSDDGMAWEVIPGWEPFPGSVPDVIRRGNILYIYCAGTQLRKYDLETDTLSEKIQVTLNDPEAPGKYVDPSLIIDDQEQLVMFYMPGVMGQDPARCAPGETQCTKLFRSAVEKEGSDGEEFTATEGNRVEVTIQKDVASDPDIFFDGKQYVLYISRGQSVEVYTSDDLFGSYAQVDALPDDFLVQEAGGVPSGFFDTETSEYWTYVHTGHPNAVIKRATHDNLTTPINPADFIEVLSPATNNEFSASFSIESPGFAENQP